MPLVSPFLLSSLADLIFPNHCLGCAHPGPVLCLSCRPQGGLLQVATPGVRCIAAAPYEGPLRRALLHYKERGRHDAAPVLGELLARSVQATAGGTPGGLDRVLLVPVPSARGARRRRGGDHMARLAEIAAERLAAAGAGLRPVPVLDLLSLSRPVRDAAGLSRDERAENLAGAMTVDSRASLEAGGFGDADRVILVDDIVTTGATVTEAVRALRGGGWPVLAAATVAATRRKAGIDREIPARSESRNATHVSREQTP
ncbi:predicted amidophosphoribosyltransferase [Jatrophihabitans sp. GAS493]|uniref:ComF family protein n=1 Tax=Jatrophihabitans sp. GAS493 TaxID=1907575 RepID=UPI000BBF4D6F|nr:phosphoribosyltransferase family protein [Jatrophihabitans sp. GAS493]SOD73104.1 predicted amidophosphoribosyltransferase [Jatrophihabitans sp. GAS493]